MMPGPVEKRAKAEIAKAEARIAANALNHDTQNMPIFFKGDAVQGYTLKPEALTEGEQAALVLLRDGKMIKSLIDKDDPDVLKDGGLVATVEWVAAKCEALGC
jgi:hypothetical protein